VVPRAAIVVIFHYGKGSVLAKVARTFAGRFEPKSDSNSCLFLVARVGTGIVCTYSIDNKEQYFVANVAHIGYVENKFFG
jgi:hypothetical protein